MRKLYLLIILIFTSVSLGAQTSDFDRAYKACEKTRNSFGGGMAAQDQLNDAANTLKSLKIKKLNLQPIKGTAKPLTGHMLFTGEFIEKAINDQSILDLADKYAKKRYQSQHRRLRTGAYDHRDDSEGSHIRI